MTSSVVGYGTARPLSHRGESLADVLERVLDKGVVIAGDIVVNVLDIELLTLKVRLLIASADTAREMGINWWENDPFLNSQAQVEQGERGRLQAENNELRQRLDELERTMRAIAPARDPQGSTSDREAGRG